MKRCLKCNHPFESKDWQCPRCGYLPHKAGDIHIFAPDLAVNNNNYETNFFSNLATLEKGHFWFEARNQLLLWAVNRYFPNIKKLLEVGCGTGFVLEYLHHHLPQVELSGSDLLMEGISYTFQRVPTAHLMQMDARDIPYKHEFDLICACDVIEHIEEDELALSQMYNALNPGGGILITVPQHQLLWSRVDDLSYHKRRYTNHDLANKVERAGFQILKTTSFVSLLMPLMLLNRSRKMQKNNDFDLYGEFKINPLLNRALTGVMALEGLLIRSDISFLFGGSRLLIAIRPR